MLLYMTLLIFIFQKVNTYKRVVDISILLHLHCKRSEHLWTCLLKHNVGLLLLLIVVLLGLHLLLMHHLILVMIYHLRLIMVHWLVLRLLVILLVIHMLLLLGHDHSLLGLRVKHSVALNMAQVAHIALISERIVVVKASLTCPISNIILWFHTVFLSHSVIKMHSVLWLRLSSTIFPS